MSQQITRAVEPERIAKPLIKDYHPHLAEARIAFLFTDIETKERGRTKAARAIKLTGVAHYLSAREDHAPYDFAILFSEPTWEKMEAAEREALVDHELCHLGRTECEWAIMSHRWRCRRRPWRSAATSGGGDGNT